MFFANGGVSLGADRILDATAENFMAHMKTNTLRQAVFWMTLHRLADFVNSVFLATKHGARGMLQTSDEKRYPGGSIIATASTAGLRSNAGPTAYSASKSAGKSAAVSLYSPHLR